MLVFPAGCLRLWLPRATGSCWVIVVILGCLRLGSVLPTRFTLLVGCLYSLSRACVYRAVLLFHVGCWLIVFLGGCLRLYEVPLTESRTRADLHADVVAEPTYFAFLMDGLRLRFRLRLRFDFFLFTQKREQPRPQPKRQPW